MADQEKRYVNPLSNLTDEQWREAMRNGLEASEAQSANIRRDMIDYYWMTRIPEAREALSKADSALRAYLEQPTSEPHDDAPHMRLASALKRATDDLKHSTDEYVRLILIHYHFA